MANDVFNVATDVEISLYTYASDIMVWDVSRWDQDNWSTGSESLAWQAITASVARVSINNGISVDQGLTRCGTPSATVVFQDSDFDPFVNSTVRSGTPVRIRVRPNPDTAPSTWVTLFNGKIDSSSASYNNKWVNTVTLDCVTDLRDILNYTSSVGMSTGVPGYTFEYVAAMNNLADFNEIAMAGSGNGYLMTGINTSNPVGFGSVINQLLDATAGALVYRPISVPNQLVPYRFYMDEDLRDVSSRTADVDFEAVVTSDPKRADFSDIVIGYNTDQLVNRVTWSTTNGLGPVTLSNASSRALLGDLGIDLVTIHNTLQTDWASGLAQVLPERQVLEITAPVILRAGQVNENLLRDPMDVASVSVDNAKITINEKYLISNVSHYIDVHTWDTTFTLWRGR
jgi:hypothetical protein